MLSHQYKFPTRCKYAFLKIFIYVSFQSYIKYVFINMFDMKYQTYVNMTLALQTKFIHIWGLWCQEQVSQAGISNYIPRFTVGCNHLSLPEIPASGTKVLTYDGNLSHPHTCQWLSHLNIFHFDGTMSWMTKNWSISVCRNFLMKANILDQDSWHTELNITIILAVHIVYSSNKTPSLENAVSISLMSWNVFCIIT